MVEGRTPDTLAADDVLRVVTSQEDRLEVIHDPAPAAEVSTTHFRHLSDSSKQRLFLRAPEAVTPESLTRHGAAWSTGALLYTPGNRRGLVDDIERAGTWGATSIVLDAEDSIEASGQVHALVNIASAIDDLFYDCDEPLGTTLYVRVPRSESIWQLATHLGGNARHLAGIILPKATPADVTQAGVAIDRVSREFGTRWQLAPIIETEQFARADSRRGQLAAMKTALNQCSAHVPWVRIGAVDLAGLYGIRRTPHQTTHELPLLAGIIADITSVMNTPQEGFPVTGAVCELLDMATKSAGNGAAIPARVARKTFESHTFVRETQQDIMGGLIGKSVIHPAQGVAVNALLPVLSGDYLDAKSIASNQHAVSRSFDGTRMNETAPHALWAERTLERAQVCGILKPDITHAHVWEVSIREAHRRWTDYSA